MAFAVWWVHPTIGFDTDSPRYLANSPMRTATYPLFLDAVNGPALLPIQLLLFAAALSWLAIQSSRFLPWIVSAAMVLAIAANPYVWQLQGTIMSEALTTPLLTLIVGCIVAFAMTQRAGPAIAAGLLCGIATTIRPPLLLFVLAPLCAVWIAPNLTGRIRLSAIILLVWLAPIGMERLYSRAVHGSELTSPLGRNIFMKAAIIDGPATTVRSADPLDRRLVQALNQDFEPVRRAIDKAQDRDVRLILMTNYESCAGYPCANSVVAGFHRSEADIHRHLLKVGVARLESNPLGYLELAASEYPRMWLLHPRKVPELARKYNAFLAREAPLPFQSLLGVEGQPTPEAEQKPIYLLNRIAFAGIGIVAALMTIGFVFWRRGALTQAAFSLLLGTEAVLVFSTFFGVGLPRYAMGMWPTLIAGELLGLAGLLAAWKPELLRLSPN
jgi:hypothetical protein